MSLTVSGTSAISSTSQTSSTATTQMASEEEVLFAPASETSTQNALELKLAQLEAELAVLESQRQEKVDYKKELEQQKAAILRQKAQIEAQIKANEEAIKKNNEVIQQNEQNIQNVQKEIEELEKQYEAKTSVATEINEKLNEKIAEIIKASEEDFNAQSEKVKNATDEAYAKVASGEISEDEVADYVSKKLGGKVVGTNADFGAIYSMNQQLRTLTEESRAISNMMSVKSDLISSYQANIQSALSANQEIAKANAPLNKQIKELDSQLATIDKEIISVDKEIAVYDGKIASKKLEIADVKAQLGGSTFNPVNPDTNSVPETRAPGSLAGEQAPSIQGTTTIVAGNPFLAISYSQDTYINMVDALDAMYDANQQSIASAQALVNNNNERMRAFFAFA